jgi:predicted amidophosphoribosyltransferase
VELDRDQRAENVKNAFQVDETAAPSIRGKTVLLVDDVCTTGATLRECAKALKSGGAAAVYAVTLARQIPSSRTAEEFA